MRRLIVFVALDDRVVSQVKDAAINADDPVFVHPELGITVQGPGKTLKDAFGIFRVNGTEQVVSVKVGRLDGLEEQFVGAGAPHKEIVVDEEFPHEVTGSASHQLEFFLALLQRSPRRTDLKQ